MEENWSLPVCCHKYIGDHCVKVIRYTWGTLNTVILPEKLVAPDIICGLVTLCHHIQYRIVTYNTLYYSRQL